MGGVAPRDSNVTRRTQGSSLMTSDLLLEPWLWSRGSGAVTTSGTLVRLPVVEPSIPW
jgi:hypothetical protein